MNPQTTLGRHEFRDPQALRNPRPPLGLAESRYSGALRYDFITDTDGFTGVNATVSYDSVNQSIVVTSDAVPTDGESSRFLNEDTAISTSEYRYVECRLKLNERPDDIYNWAGEFRWEDSGSGIWRGPLSIPEPDWNRMGDPYQLLLWDMYGINFDASPRTSWKSTATKIRFDLWGTPPDTSGALEVDYVRFLPFPESRASDTKGGVTNYNFESPSLYPSHYTSQQGGLEPIPGWTVAGDPLSYPGGNMGVYRPQSTLTLPNGELNVAYTDPTLSGEDRSFSQSTTVSLVANTKYTLNVDVGMRSNYSDPISYEVRLKAGDDTLVTESSLNPSAGYFLTSTSEYTTGSSHSQLGKSLVIELVGTGTRGVNSQIAWNDVFLSYEDV
tara:strand:- start:3659 stop:4813 length:1155 start_codon:yes stop_codon:yes gene_type:complete